VSAAAVRTEEDARRLIALGLPEGSVRVTGNLKYDADLPDREESADKAAEWRARLGWGKDAVWTTGSTHPGEEEAVLDAFLSAKAKRPDLRLVLAPRHVERAGQVEEALRTRGISFVALSRIGDGPVIERAAQTGSPGAAPDCLLVDRMGFLSGLYALGDFAFVGGTLAPVGGHNLLEPALAGKPVLFGPHTESVTEAARVLLSSKGGRRADDARMLSESVDHFLSDPAFRQEAGRKAQGAARELSGAVSRTMDFLKPLLLAKTPGHK